MALTHLDDAGKARMVDISGKAVTARTAIAEGHIAMSAEALAAVRDATAAKGDVLAVARIAGITAAKKTADLIPLCHPLSLSAVSVDLAPNPKRNAIDITATVKTTGPTGVEMEALTAVAVAALTVYDMCKAADRAMVLSDIRLDYKSGGKSGVYRRTR